MGCDVGADRRPDPAEVVPRPREETAGTAFDEMPGSPAGRRTGDDPGQVRE